MRRIALLSGGDWADASVLFFDIPQGMDLKYMKGLWDDWYIKEYGKEGVDYQSFESFLLDNGATYNNDIEEHHEDELTDFRKYAKER